MMRFRYVSASHWIPAGRLKGAANDFFTIDPVDHAIVASPGDRSIAGWFRFDLDGKGRLLAAGTWVEPPWRKHGVAYDLWSRVIERYDPTTVVVKTISGPGRMLVGSLVREFKDVEFRVLA